MKSLTDYIGWGGIFWWFLIVNNKFLDSETIVKLILLLVVDIKWLIGVTFLTFNLSLNLNILMHAFAWLPLWPACSMLPIFQFDLIATRRDVKLETKCQKDFPLWLFCSAQSFWVKKSQVAQLFNIALCWAPLEDYRFFIHCSQCFIAGPFIAPIRDQIFTRICTLKTMSTEQHISADPGHFQSYYQSLDHMYHKVFLPLHHQRGCALQRVPILPLSKLFSSDKLLLIARQWGARTKS